MTQLSNINEKAKQEALKYIQDNNYDIDDGFIDFAHGLTTKYGEAAAELSCRMYDELHQYWKEAKKSTKSLLPAEPAEVPTRSDVEKAVYGTLKTSVNEIPGAVSRLVKQTAEDTKIKNGMRDGAEFAWIPAGDSCAFCLVLASRGWQKISKKTLKNGHAEHIHANCDCTYTVRFDSTTEVEGYDPDSYYDYYKSFNGDLNAMRRENYKVNKDKINEQQRIAYRARKERKNQTLSYKQFSSGEAADEFFGQRPERSLRRENRELYDQKMEEYRNSTFGLWNNNLTSDETASIGEYSADGYSGINGLLRHQMTEKMVDAWNNSTSRTIPVMIDSITSAIDKFDLKEPIKVFRTCEESAIRSMDLKPGSIFHDDGFCSTSAITEKVASGNVVMRINVPAGKGYGAWINPLSGAEDEEYEFLLQRGSNFKVIKSEKIGEDLVIDLDLLGSEKREWSFASKEEVIKIWDEKGYEYDEYQLARI